MVTVRKISFRAIHRAHLPGPASVAAPGWRDYGDSVEVPALVLMENMGMEGAQVVFLSLRNLHHLLVPAQREGQARQVVDCQVVHLSLGQTGQVAVVREPVTVAFHHLAPLSGAREAVCVLWDPSSQVWATDHCDLVASNLTHSSCRCSRLGTFGLLTSVHQEDGLARMTFLVTVIITIAVSIVVFVSIILGFVYCYRTKVMVIFNNSATLYLLPCKIAFIHFKS